MPPPMATTRFIFVRHGETVWNTGELLQGQSDVPLSSEGVKQAAAVADALAHYPIDVIVTSPLSRARMTARSIARFHPDAPFIERPELMEQSFGIWEGKHYTEAVTMYRNGSWAETWDNPHRPAPGGESLADVATRTGSVLRDLCRDYVGQTVVVVSHGVAIRVLLREAVGIPFAHLSRVRLSNTAITMVDMDDSNRGTIVFVNNTMHLPQEPKDG